LRLLDSISSASIGRLASNTNAPADGEISLRQINLRHVRDMVYEIIRHPGNPRVTQAVGGGGEVERGD
jgi:hypothetical protein